MRDGHLHRNILLFVRNDDFGNSCAVNLGQQHDLLDALADFVLFEVLVKQVFQLLNVKLRSVFVLQVVLDVEELALAENGLHDFGVAGFDGLLRGRRDDLRPLGAASLVGILPFPPENALVLLPVILIVLVAVISPAVGMLKNESQQLLVVFRWLVVFGRCLSHDGYDVLPCLVVRDFAFHSHSFLPIVSAHLY